MATGGGSVSYTHLDVYKRQALRSASRSSASLARYEAPSMRTTSARCMSRSISETTQFGQNVVVGNDVYSILLGMSVPDILSLIHI